MATASHRRASRSGTVGHRVPGAEARPVRRRSDAFRVSRARSACTFIRTSLWMTSITLRSWPMMKVARLVGESLVNRRRTPNWVGHRSVGIGQERVVEGVLVGEALLLLHLVGADPDPLGAHRLELGLHVPEMATLRRAARGHGGRVEEQDDRARWRPARSAASGSPSSSGSSKSGAWSPFCMARGYRAALGERRTGRSRPTGSRPGCGRPGWSPRKMRPTPGRPLPYRPASGAPLAAAVSTAPRPTRQDRRSCRTPSKPTPSRRRSPASTGARPRRRELRRRGGTVFGLLGPTAPARPPRCASSPPSSRPDGGSARVLGHDVRQRRPPWSGASSAWPASTRRSTRT